MPAACSLQSVELGTIIITAWATQVFLLHMGLPMAL